MPADSESPDVPDDVPGSFGRVPEDSEHGTVDDRQRWEQQSPRKTSADPRDDESAGARDADSYTVGPFDGEDVFAAEKVQVVAPRRRPGYPAIAWLVIAATTCFSVLATQMRRDDPDRAQAEQVQLALLEMQARYFVGAAELSGPTRPQLAAQAELFYRGSLRERMAATILIGDLGGPEAAQSRLDELHVQVEQSDVEFSDVDVRLLVQLQELYERYVSEDWNAANVTVEHREFLQQELGWFAKLALTPRQGDAAARQELLRPARRTVFVAVGGVTTMFLLGLGGLAVCAVLVSMLVSGNLQSRLKWSRHGGIYIETFAAWMVGFLGLSIVTPLIIRSEDSPLAPQFVVSGVSLLALVWPVLRGVSWRQVRHDLGLFGGRRWYFEPLCGFVCYVATLPGLAVCLLIVVLFSGLPIAQMDFTPTNVPAHPILLWVRDAGSWQRFQVFLLACVAAPVLEETMFRGLMYRHLREATGRLRMSFSVLFSAIFNGLIFAVIHPQGLLAVPALATLAIGFSLAREWRGSLIAPMTAHALNNSIVTAMLLTLL